MEQYIKKSALVAKIEKRKKEAYGNEWGWAVQCATYDEILSILDTLEVKEVDLEEEIESYFKGFGKYPSVGIDDCIDIARHFFEFGLKSKEKRRSMGKHNCPYFSENAQVCDDGDCHHYECLRRIEKIKAQKKEENATK